MFKIHFTGEACGREVQKEKGEMRLKSYRCYCGFKTGIRKKIRQHVREVHGIKGGAEHSSSGTVLSDITNAYTAVERGEGD